MFQITLRSLTCREIADNPAVAADIRRQYQTLEKVTTPASVLLPWFPSWAMIMKWFATIKIYYIITQALKRRERNSVPQDDTLQMFLDLKDDNLTFVGVCFDFASSLKNLLAEPLLSPSVLHGFHHIGRSVDWLLKCVLLGFVMIRKM
jgi:hypothetical protein